MPEVYYQVPVLGVVRLDLPEIPPLLALQAHVPGLCETACRPDTLSLTYNQQQSDILYDGGRHISLGGPWSTERNGDTPHLLYALCRRAWLQQGYGLMHAAALQGPDAGAVLLVGHSGSGKTTISEHACASKAFRLLSGNKTLLRFEGGQARVIAGTPISSVLQEDGTRELVAVPAGSLPAPTKGVVLIRLNDGACQWQQLMALNALHTLLPMCLDSVNADILAAGTALFDGGVSQLGKQKMADGLRESLQRIPVYRAVGSLSHVSEKIRGLV